MSKEMDELVQKERDQQYFVVKSNELIQKSRYDLSLQQQKMLLFAISKIKPLDIGDEEYEFSIVDFCKAAGLNIDDGGFYYHTLKTELKKLRDASAWLTMPDGTEELFSWLYTVKIVKKSGIIKIRFHESVQPYLYMLKEKYTQYRLEEVLPFQSKYSIRLYELLRSYTTQPKLFDQEEVYKSFTPEDLKKRLSAENYDRFFDFRKRVLLPAIEEINKYSQDMRIEYHEVREGRAVTALRFIITGKNNLERAASKAQKRNKIG